MRSKQSGAALTPQLGRQSSQPQQCGDSRAARPGTDRPGMGIPMPGIPMPGMPGMPAVPSLRQKEPANSVRLRWSDLRDVALPDHQQASGPASGVNNQSL